MSARRWQTWVGSVLVCALLGGGTGPAATAASAAAAAAEVEAGPRVAADGSPALQDLLAQNVGADPGAAWPWVEALRDMRPQDRQAPLALQRGLLELYLQQGGGQPVPAMTTVADAMALGTALGVHTYGAREEQGWRQLLQTQLRVAWPEADLPLPDELDFLAARMKAVAPGVWTSTLADGQPRPVSWLLSWRHVGTVPLAPASIELRVQAAAHAQPVDFECNWPRGVTRQVWLPGQTHALLCRSTMAWPEQSAGWQQALQRIRRHDDPALTWSGPDLRRSQSAAAMMQLLAGTRTSTVPGFFERHRSCESRGRCAAEPTLAQRQADDRQALRQRAALGRAELARITLVYLVALLCYALVARAFSEWAARVLTLVVLLAVSTYLGLAGLEAGGLMLLIVAPATIAALTLGAFGLHLGYRVYARIFFRPPG